MITTTTVMIRIIIIVIITTVTNSIICKSEDSRRGAGCVVRPQKICLISSLIPLGGGGVVTGDGHYNVRDCGEQK